MGWFSHRKVRKNEDIWHFVSEGTGNIFAFVGFATNTQPIFFEMLKLWRIKWPRHVSARVRNLYRNITINEKEKGHFGIIAGVGKIILQWILKTVFEGVDWFHVTQDVDH